MSSNLRYMFTHVFHQVNAINSLLGWQQNQCAIQQGLYQDYPKGYCS